MDKQLLLFDVLDSYAGGACDNNRAYEQVGKACSISGEEWEAREPVGSAQAMHSPLKRRVRWHQQTLRRMGLLEPVAGKRGHWQATHEGRRTIEQRQRDLEPSAPGMIKLGFSTELGMALWADCRDAFSAIDEPIHMVLTSPPYPLARPRDYGNPSRDEFVDWLCACLEPLVKRLVSGGSIFLNLSNDIFEQGSPERSLYRERLVLALHDRLGLKKLDEWVWHNPNKAPGPVQWASLRRVQLNSGWEPIYWFSNDARACFTDNRRVLRPHTEKHAKYIQNGGAGSAAVFAGGANRRRVGAFSGQTEGAIPRNVITARHNCPSQAALREWAKREGLPMHSATMPLDLAEMMVRFATEPGQLVADPFGGWATTALAAERNSRRWIVTERMRAYLYASQWRLTNGVDDE